MSTVGSLSSSAIQSQVSAYQARLQAPITALQSQTTTEKADISAWGAIKGTVSTLSTALAGISNLASLTARSATSTSSSVAKATVTNSAQAGTYALSHVSLAHAQSIYSGLKTSGSASIGASAGSLTFVQNGKTETVALGSGSLTLNGVAAAINKAAGGVSASVVSTTAGARLALQSSTTGSSQAFSVTGTGALAAFNFSPSGTTTGSWTVAQSAKNAALTVNGIPLSNASNTISSALTGVSLTLAGSGSTTVQVSKSSAAISSALSSVAKSLNAAVASIATQTKYAPPTTTTTGTTTSSASAAKSGPLIGNFTATNLSYQLVSAVSGAAASGLTSNAIGLTVNSSGNIAFNQSTFGTAYASNPTGVQNLLTSIYNSLNNVTTGALGNGGKSASGTAAPNSSGSIGAQTTALNSQVTSINSQITQITKQNSSALQNLLTQYTAAETAASSASISQSYLSIFLSSTTSSS
jgi:flagellar hook-associated protein 2